MRELCREQSGQRGFLLARGSGHSILWKTSCIALAGQVVKISSGVKSKISFCSVSKQLWGAEKTGTRFKAKKESHAEAAPGFQELCIDRAVPGGKCLQSSS